MPACLSGGDAEDRLPQGLLVPRKGEEGGRTTGDRPAGRSGEEGAARKNPAAWRRRGPIPALGRLRPRAGFSRKTVRTLSLLGAVSGFSLLWCAPAGQLRTKDLLLCFSQCALPSSPQPPPALGTA